MFKYPRKLKYGDTLGLIGPASPTSQEKVEKSRDKLQALGFKVKMGKSLYTRYGYLSGEDSIRAYDINNMFNDKEVHGIICIRGGYGSPRILDLIDYNIVKDNPKVFIGYSDITAIHIAFSQIGNLVTFHGPMPAPDMIEDFPDFSKESLFSAIMDSGPMGIISNPPGKDIEIINGGLAEGTIIGGNLSLIVDTLGTKYEIHTRGKILFIEEVGEEIYKIDRMLNQLRLAGKFQEANGIILGTFKDCKQDKEGLTLKQVINDQIKTINKPTIFNLQAGHCKPMITLPFGVKARLDGDKKELYILETTTNQ